MDFQPILTVLRIELSRIDQAIAALESLGAAGLQNQPRKAAIIKSTAISATEKHGRRRMSASAKKRIGAAKKAWWADQKKAQAKPQKAKKPASHLTAAGRKKLSRLMKARWAARRTAKAS
jgi:hypothetical protein